MKRRKGGVLMGGWSRQGRWATLVGAVTLGAMGAPGITPGAVAAPGASPAPGSPQYIARDVQNMESAFGREIGPNGELDSPAYLATLGPDVAAAEVDNLLAATSNPLDPALSAGTLVPGFSAGTPDRAHWNGRRGRELSVHFAAPDGAVLSGTLFAPLIGATDPYTHGALASPYPGAVIVTGSIQATAAMYSWLAEDLAERGYMVLTFDVQGQGQSETFPQQGPVPGIAGCDLGASDPSQATACAGFPSEQQTNFDQSTEAAISYFESTDNPWSVSLEHTFHNAVDPSRDVPLALIGHSTGAVTASYLQQSDDRIATIVALDKITATCAAISDDEAEITMPAIPCPIEPKVPALGIQAEYGFAPQPYWEASCSSFEPCVARLDTSNVVPDLAKAPDPTREEATGFDTWQAGGSDSMVVVPRASTHLDFTDEPPSLPASRWGQAMASYYVQAWLDKYLKGHEQTPAALERGAAPHLLATSLTYLAPTHDGVWKPVTLDRDGHLSFYFCSGYAFDARNGNRSTGLVDDDLVGAGCNHR